MPDRRPSVSKLPCGNETQIRGRYGHASCIPKRQDWFKFSLITVVSTTHILGISLQKLNELQRVAGVLPLTAKNGWHSKDDVTQNSIHGCWESVCGPTLTGNSEKSPSSVLVSTVYCPDPLNLNVRVKQNDHTSAQTPQNKYVRKSLRHKIRNISPTDSISHRFSVNHLVRNACLFLALIVALFEPSNLQNSHQNLQFHSITLLWSLRIQYQFQFHSQSF